MVVRTLRALQRTGLIVAVVVGMLGSAALAVWISRPQHALPPLRHPDLVLLSHTAARALVQQSVEIQILGNMHAALMQISNRLDRLGHSRATDAVPLRHVYPVTVVWGAQALASSPVGWHPMSVPDEYWRTHTAHGVMGLRQLVTGAR